LVSAATAGCRVLLERFANTFQRVHGLPKQKACNYDLTTASTTDILLHSESCTGMIRELLDAKIVWKNPKPTGTEDASTLFKSLSNALHQNMFQGPGNAMWVYDGLEPIEKKWMLRYLKNKQVYRQDYLSLYVTHLC
jgi:hypothetical protein